MGGEAVADGDGDTDGDGLCDGDADGDADGEVGVGTGGVLRAGGVWLGGDACGESEDGSDGEAEELAGVGDTPWDSATLPTPDRPGASAPSGTSSTALWALGVRSAGASSIALTTATAVPRPPATTAVSSPAAITNRRVGRPRRVRSRPRSYPMERTAPAASRHMLCQRLTGNPFQRRDRGVVDPALSSFRPVPA
ncbi:MAG: hypothetical protein ACRDT6_04050 [Micromonosporaceae bacterium]